ncbi:hypothetical protein [Rhizobium sp. 21-4511-3d]
MIDMSSELENENAQVGLEISSKWFEYHSGQRQDMFKTFLIITAGLGSIMGYLLQAKLLLLLALAGISLAALAALFWMIDDRSRYLVGLGEVAYERFWRALGLPAEICPPAQSSRHAPGMIRFKTLYRAAFLACIMTGSITAMVALSMVAKG